MFAHIINSLQRQPDRTNRGSRPLGNAIGRAPVLTFSLAAEAADFFAIQIAALVANGALHEGNGISLAGILGANAVGIACFFSFKHGRLYDVLTMRNERRIIASIFLHWTALCLLLTASAIFFHRAGENGRLWIGLFYSIGLAGLAFERVVLAWLIRAWLAQGNYVHAIAIVGSDELAQDLADLLVDKVPGLKFVGVFTSQDDAAVPAINELLELAAQDLIDTVIIAESGLPPNQLHATVKQLGQQPLSVYLLPGAIALEALRRSWQKGSFFPGQNLFALVDKPINEMSFLIKSATDRFLSALLLILLTPILLACAMGIRISSPGPLLFRQKRVGYKGRNFMIFKFRTMYVSERPHIKLTEKEDPRVFRFGRFLRKTSLDELPQLFNVLRGEMSLVGPRPHMPQAAAAGCLYYDAVSNYAARHRVKPGITGWAQVNGWRGPTETIDQINARVTHDLYYIENWSLLFDLTILFRTCFVLFGKNVF